LKLEPCLLFSCIQASLLFEPGLIILVRGSRVATLVAIPVVLLVFNLYVRREGILVLRPHRCLHPSQLLLIYDRLPDQATGVRPCSGEVPNFV